MGKDAGASAAAGGRRRRPDSFYPSMHTHGGGTLKVRTSAAQRQRLLESCPMPSYRRGHSLRGLVEAVATRELRATRADIDHIRAVLVQAEMIYHSMHHVTAQVLSNTPSETVGGLAAQVDEGREAQLRILNARTRTQRVLEAWSMVSIPARFAWIV